MALSKVQSAAKAAGTGTSIVLTFPAPPTVGNAVIVHGSFIDQTIGYPYTFYDNYGNRFDAVNTESADPEFGKGTCPTWLCPKLVRSGAGYSITITLSASLTFNAGATEIGGVGRGLELEDVRADYNVGTTPQSLTSAPFTTTEVVAVAVCALDTTQASITAEVVSPVWTQEWETLSSPSAGEADVRIITSAEGLSSRARWTLASSASWFAALTVFRARHSGIRFFKTTRSFNWYEIAPVTKVTAHAIGAGGSGGAATGSPATGGGGKGGGYARTVITKGTETQLSMTAGLPGPTSGTGAERAGNDSKVVRGVTTLVLAAGGNGGGNASTNSANAVGGTVHNSVQVGDLVYVGGNGGVGNYTSGVQGSGAGGGAAGPISAGGNASVNLPGNPGGGYARAGAPGVGDNTAGAAPSSLYGGGGSGGKANTTTDRLGGAGAQGCVWLEYTAPPITVVKRGSVIVSPM